MDISFILLTWNSEKYIEKCLQSLLDDLLRLKYKAEVFIVDNGSKDQTVSLLKNLKEKNNEQLFPIFLDKNTGTTYSRNLALKKANGKYVCIMDSDVEVSPGAIEYLIESLKIPDKKIGISVPRLLYPNGNLQKSTDVFPTIFTKLYRFFFLKLQEKYEHKQKKAETCLCLEAEEVDYAISAMWMLKKEVINTVGLLDEKIFYAPEDVDYCLRIWKAGYKIIYNPGISSVHHTQEISRGFKINQATFSHIRGLAYYFWKHKYIFTRPTF